MTVVETVLVFVGIPLLVLLLVAGATLAPSAMRGGARYRPGREWGHATAWWLPDPEAVGTLPAGVVAARVSHTRALASAAAERAERAGASAGEAARAGEQEAAERANAAVGGASGEW